MSVEFSTQAEFELSGVLISYDYKDNITFDTSGGSGTGDVLFTVDPRSKIRFSASSNYITDLSLVNLSDNTNNATITGTVEYTYKDGRYCYYIHPTESYITLPTGLLDSTIKFTFSAFYYLKNDFVDYNFLLGNSHGVTESYAYRRSVDIGGRKLYMNSISNTLDLSNVLTYDSWNFFCYTYDEEKQQTKVYINGLLVNTINNRPFNLVEPLFIGAFNQSGTIQAYGGFYFDAINIYDKVLTPEQIAKMYPSTNNTLPNDVTISDYTVTAFKEADQNYLSTSNYFDFTINQPGNMPVEKYILKIVAAERNNTNPSYYPCVLINNVQVGRLDFSSINKATWNEFTFNINLDPTVSSLELKIQVNRFTVTGYCIDKVKLFHENDSTTNLIFNPEMYVNSSNLAQWNTQNGEWFLGPNIGLYNETTFANDNLRDGDNYQLFLERTGHIKQTLNITRNSIEQSANPNTFDVDLSFSNPFSTEPVKSASYTFSSSNQSPLSTYVYTNYFEQYKLQFNARSRPNNTITLFTDIYYSTTNIFDTSSLVLLGTVSPKNNDTTVFSYDISLSPTTEYFAIRFENSTTNNPDVYDGNFFYNIQLIAYNPTTGITTNSNLIADSDMKLGTGGLNINEWYKLLNNYNESWYIYSNSKTAIHEKNTTSINIVENESTIIIDTNVNANTETVCIFGKQSYLIQELAINRTYDTVTDKITTTFTNKINNQITDSYDYTRYLNIANAQYEYSSPSQINFTTYGGSGTGDLLFTVDPISKIRLSASSNYISGTSLENLSDNTNNATITGTVEYTYIGGRYCYYIYNSIRSTSGSGTYDGTKNYITLPTGLLDSTIKFTFSAFYYIKNDFVDYNFLLGSSHGVTESYAYRRSVDIGRRKLYMNSNSNSSTLDLSTVLNHDSWNFFCYTYDDDIKQTKVYINGSLVNTVDDVSFNLVEPLFIGAFNELGDIKPYGGFYFDAINIYDTVLTPEQVAKMYPSTLNTDISPGDYTVTAFNEGDQNYLSTSNSFELNIIPGDQAVFELSGVLTSYDYKDDITFDTSGGSGTGDVSFILEHDTFGIISIDNNRLTEDISGGDYRVIATKFGDSNYKDISAHYDFTIDPIDQADFELYNVDTSYNHRYDIVFDTSGGSGDGVVSYTVKHDTYGLFTVEGDTFTEDISVGHYTVTATKAASLNFIEKSATFDFSINVINQDLLEFYNVSSSYPYKRNITLDTIGGSGSGIVTVGVSHNEYGTIPLVNGNTIVQDICAGFYTITATKGASLNFYEESITSTITVTKIDQDPFFITNESSYVFVEGQSIDIDTNGGSIDSDITVVINLVNDEENFDDITLFNPNGEPRIILPDAGTYIIRATKDGDINYVPAITNSIITITQATQSNLLFYNQPSYVYDPIQTIPLDASGGSGDGAITFNVLYNGGELTDVTELVAPVVGDYWIEITKAESKNYFSITQEFPITILKADQLPLVNETLISSIVYYPELVIDLSASGGTTDKPITFTINGEPGTQLNSANNTNYIGNYSIVATKEGNENYNDVTLNFTISITKLLQLPIEITVPSVNNYELQNSSIEAKIKGGSTDNDFIISFDSNAMTINNRGTIDEEGNQIYDIFYTRPGTVSMIVLKKGNEDYMDVSATVQIDIVKNMNHIKNTLHIRPRKAFNDPYIDKQDIISVYTVDELVDNMITNVFNPDPDLKNRFNTHELLNMNVNACVVYGTRRFTAADLKAGGYKITFCTR